MTDQDGLKELIKMMAKLLPITIEDAAKVIAKIHSGYEIKEILKEISKFKKEISIEIGKRRERYNKGDEGIE